VTERLAHRRLLVTGGASGIGRATVDAFLREGARVAVLDRDEHALRGVAQDGLCHAFACDIRDEAAVDAAVARAAASLGGLDGLVHSAGVTDGTPLEQASFDAWRTLHDINVHGTFLVCRATVPWLRRAGGGTVVNLGSAQALLPMGSPLYAASKGAVVAFSKAIAVELAPAIRVNVVCPGTIDTPMLERVARERPGAIERNLAGVPMQRTGTAREVAELIVYLTSAESSFVTGAAIAVDGGRTRH
jgi:NAD(P)-dependent dehydrogenase (short-subunit alcohol dehydrogenase family)